MEVYMNKHMIADMLDVNEQTAQSYMRILRANEKEKGYLTLGNKVSSESVQEYFKVSNDTCLYFYHKHKRKSKYNGKKDFTFVDLDTKKERI